MRTSKFGVRRMGSDAILLGGWRKLKVPSWGTGGNIATKHWVDSSGIEAGGSLSKTRELLRGGKKERQGQAKCQGAPDISNAVVPPSVMSRDGGGTQNRSADKRLTGVLS